MGAFATGHNNPNWCAGVLTVKWRRFRLRTIVNNDLCVLKQSEGWPLAATAAMNVKESNNELDACR